MILAPESGAGTSDNGALSHSRELEHLAQTELERAKRIRYSSAAVGNHLLGELALFRNDPRTAITELEIELATKSSVLDDSLSSRASTGAC